ncbi:uncharacterized protein LOC117891379 isoform X1 [Drosophila subobscura]|uniref:uncharacterized protein LOC117891379 isoform X1 n=1 Tax=Drosophila subobscura TaxID=7241 RepID=UPI00155A07F3|nr:uncharacterized protein LOC117891379 isoform X1 [Drosophila subobscura]
MCHRLIFLLIFLSVWPSGNAFEVHFQESYPSERLATDQESDLHKRAADVPQFFDKASFSFDGLTRVASVPVLFPLDICILQLPAVKYATALHKDAAGVRHFAVFAWRPAEQSYELQLELPTPKAVALDCLAYAGRGYVALSYNLTEPVQLAREGSPIYELSPETGVRTVQYFGGLRLRGMYLRISSQELTLLQAFDSEVGPAAVQQQCPYFKWTGGTFQRLGAIPCSNARRMEAFGIDYADYVAVANYANAQGRTATRSDIYKYNPKNRRFQLFQRLRSNGAVDVKYFSLPVNEVSRRHFLILGNTIGGSSAATGEADTVIYVYEKGQFVPYQRLSFYALERFLPVQHSISEKFLLLVACNKQDVKIYNLNDWKFEESKVQFTEGALSRGVARMRSYEEQQQSYLVIANENMAANETNIFQPLYKQDEHANVLRQQIIDWAREQQKRLEQINVDQLLKGLQQRAKQREQIMMRSRIKRVKSKSLVDEHMKLSANYWDALQYAKQALDVIEEDAKAARTRHPMKRAAAEQHEFEEITVDTLVVSDSMRASNINGLDAKEPVYESVTASKVYVSEEYKEPAREQQKPFLQELSVQQLQLEGNLNDLNWTQLLEQTLKRSSVDVQFIKSAADITHLSAEAVVVNGNEINDRSLGHLIPVDGGEFVVQQEVQFSQPIQVNRLLINQRLNHIHVDRQRFDLLLREANHTQVIEGSKRLENLRVMEPITIAGQLLGAELRAMSPVKITHQSLQLQGDFVIDGDVTIDRLLQVGDLLDASTGRSASEALTQGLRLDETIQDVNVKFEQPLVANNTELSFVNAEDLQKLVKLNVEEVQVVEGSKTLPQGLEISEGFGEVKWLNGIDVEKLPEVLLTKSGNQSIAIAVQLQGLELGEVKAQPLVMNGLELDDYLQVSKEQNSNGTLYVDQLDGEEVHLEEMHMNGMLFGQPLASIYSHGSQSLDGWKLPANFNGSIRARNMWLKGSINLVNVAQLEQQLQQLAGNIKYVGDFSFRHSVNISSLSFGHSLNGIQAAQFGGSWLEASGDQNFTAPQVLAALESSKGVQLQGKLNNYTLDELVSRSYRLNASEHLQSVRFENPIVLQSELLVGRVNGLRVPEDMLYTDAGGYLSAPVTINGSLEVAELCNLTSLNGYHLATLDKYLNGEQHDTFHAENVKFEGPPTYKYLNGHQAEQLLDQVWLDSERIELGGTEQRLEFASTAFEGLLDFHGPINGFQVEHIKRNYFSRTRGQQVSAPLGFRHDVTFAQPLTARVVTLRGSVSNGNDALVEGMGNFSLDFDDFVANTLKTAGVHKITGHWNLPESHVEGNLNNVLINQLNLVDDVLRLSENNVSTQSTTIDALKTIDMATISRLYASSPSLVANTSIATWINEAVYIYGNHSIAGTTRLQNVNLYNDLAVEGPVNGIHWQPDKLLLRNSDQYVAGSLLVDNSLPEQQRILSNNIDSLWVDSVNGLSVNELLENKARNLPNLHVESPLIFTQPLTVENYEQVTGNGNLESSYKSKRGVDMNALADWQQLQQNVAAVQHRLEEPPKVLENFIVLQQLPHKDVSRMETLTMGDDDVLAIRQRPDKVDYYTWQPEAHIFSHRHRDSNANLSTLLHPNNNTNSVIFREDSWVTNKKLEFGMGTSQCQAVQEVNELIVKCLDKNGTSRQAAVDRWDAKQLLVVAATDSPILLLTSKAVELWKISERQVYTLVRRLLDVKAEQMALIQRGLGMQSSYMALITSSPAADIRIYSFSSEEMSNFQLEQVLELRDSHQAREVRFMHLPESEDLLLCVSNALPEQPLTIYKHQGAAGFQKILGDSALPEVQSLEVLQLSSKQLHFLAVATSNAVYVVVPQITPL